MKLDRTFTTEKSVQVVRDLIADYLEGKGYKQQESDPDLVYKRGSMLGSMASFSTKHWKSIVTVQIRSAGDETTSVVATFDIDTTGQLVIKKERVALEKELEGLVSTAGGFNVDRPLDTKIEEKLVLEKRLREGANWFYWIAGLSIVNTVIMLMGGSMNFLIGLGITQFIDGISMAIAQEFAPEAWLLIRGIALVLNVLIAGVFVLFGVLARRYKWGFWVGMVVYALDGLIFLIVPDFLSIGFHLFGLYGLFNGLRALGQLKQRELSLVAELQ